MRTANTGSGNSIQVTIAIMGRSSEVVTLPVDATVEEAFRAANIQLSPGEFAMVAGENADFNALLDDGDVITVSSHKKGGRI